MKNIIQIISNKTLLFAASLGLVSTLAFAGATTVSAVDCGSTPNAPACKAKEGVTGIGGDQAGRGAPAFTNLIQNVINILLFIIGAAAVIMIIIGGIRYTVSGGDQGAVTSAKNTILYAIVGLIVAIIAYAIVNWVIGAL